jgi:outer membrane protein assembly factor BamD (BamD/ComL family)
LKALETEALSVLFEGRFYPQLTESKRPAEIQITRGATITAVYRDQENTDPGIPTERTVNIEHAKYNDPVFDMFTVSTEKTAGDKKPSKNSKRNNSKRSSDKRGRKQESVAVRRSIIRDSIKGDKAGADNLKSLINSSIAFNVTIPHLALANSSRTHVYVQTESGRKLAMEMAKKAGKEYKAPAGFDVNVPGTLKVEGQPSFGGNIIPPLGYAYGGTKKAATSRVSAVNKSALDKGIFAFNIPVKLGEIPPVSYANRSSDTLSASEMPKFLAVRPGDKVYIAYPYFGEADFYDDKKADRKPIWFNAQYSLDSHLFLDMLDSDFNKPLKNAFVGEKVYLRIIAPNLDTSRDRDSTQILIEAGNGVKSNFSLHETEVNSGIFKGIFKLSYLTHKDPKRKLPPVELNGFPVLYGDSVTVSYPQKISDPPDSLSLTVNKGADGLVKPYSKRYADSGIAIKTSFTMAECFFELARQHKLASKEAANPEQKKLLESRSRMRMQHAEKLLKEAMDAHRDEEQQAHAEYLLGNLAQEYAALSKNDQTMKSKYSDALVRYKKVVSDYPEAMFASKAQYKVAYVYDKMDKIENIQTMEIAIEEYVKLAYKYPQDELIPKVLSRIGTYFQDRGKQFKEEAKAIEKKGEEGDGEHLMQQAHIEYLKAANVFNKLHSRFPTDPLAPLAELRAAQNYMRSEMHDKAADVFLKIMENEDLDGESVRAQAMYWAGICYERGAKPKTPLWKGGQQRAVQLYNRTRYEFPSSKWAKHARGRLVDPGLEEAVAVEEEKKERMLEQIKLR